MSTETGGVTQSALAGANLPAVFSAAHDGGLASLSLVVSAGSFALMVEVLWTYLRAATQQVAAISVGAAQDPCLT
jgi:hypothetical protein